MIRLMDWRCLWVVPSSIMKNLKKQTAAVARHTFTLSTSLAPLLMLVCALVLQSGQAQAQADAYSVEVAVADRGSAEQQAAYEAAFRRVLLDNSGDKTLLNRDAVRAALRQAERYVSAFSYRTPPPGTLLSRDTPITEEVRSTGQATQLMMVSFDRALVRELIDSSAGRSAQEDEPEPVASRGDSALVWLLIQDGGRDIMISDPQAANVQARAREIAGAAGLSLVFPAGDETDQQAVTVDDMLNQNLQGLIDASARYEQSTILIGSLGRNGPRGWRGQWVQLSPNEPVHREFETGTLDEALQQGLGMLSANGAIDESYRYGGTASAATEGLVWVGSVDSLKDYATMMNFLEAVPSVATVFPKEIHNTSMVFSVVPRSALRDIESASLSQNWLRRTAPPFNADSRQLGQSADLALEIGR